MATSTALLILAFGGIGFLLVTMVLYTLAVELKHGIDRHELIREARRRRIEYVQQLEARMNPDVEIAHEGPAVAGTIEPDDDAEPLAIAEPAAAA